MFTWARCQYTLSRKVRLIQHHETPNCDGWSKERGVGVLGPLLARCGCPFEAREQTWVWLVDPRDKEVVVDRPDGEPMRIKHGRELDQTNV